MQVRIALTKEQQDSIRQVTGRDVDEVAVVVEGKGISAAIPCQDALSLWNEELSDPELIE